MKKFLSCLGWFGFYALSVILAFAVGILAMCKMWDEVINDTKGKIKTFDINSYRAWKDGMVE